MPINWIEFKTIHTMRPDDRQWILVESNYSWCERCAPSTTDQHRNGTPLCTFPREFLMRFYSEKKKNEETCNDSIQRPPHNGKRFTNSRTVIKCGEPTTGDLQLVRAQMQTCTVNKHLQYVYRMDAWVWIPLVRHLTLYQLYKIMKHFNGYTSREPTNR